MHKTAHCVDNNTHTISLSLSFSVSYTQCDQIGWFWKFLGDKLCFISSPNVWWLFGLFWKHHFLSKNSRGYFLANFWKDWATFLFQHLVTLLIHLILSPILSPSHPHHAHNHNISLSHTLLSPNSHSLSLSLLTSPTSTMCVTVGVRLLVHTAGRKPDGSLTFIFSLVKILPASSIVRSFVRPISVWPDLAKFRHFGKALKLFEQFLKALISFGKKLNPLWQIFRLLGQFAVFEMAKYLKII